ncbi:MAG TPA: bifunctional glycosyltransferase family 2/GtrA family protein [Lachnospiraceae bacterium]|nr:bifunctional glycosyltransferase family 2/GtrA family protein [Lachnospiraceae bacterium]
MEKESRVVVLIPAYNPDQKMLELINETAEQFEHIVVVNDGCSEEYAPVFEAIRDKVTLLVHEVNRGKGCALKTGFSYIQDKMKDAQGVVTIDADGQHTLTDTRKCCNAFLEHPRRAIFGCRDFTSDSKIPPRSRFGNRLTSQLLQFFCDISLSDTQTGLRVLPTAILDQMLLVPGERYEYEMNMIFRLKELSVAFVEVPIAVIYIDDNASSHFNPIRDSLKIYKVFGKFCISSFGSAILDYGLFLLVSHFAKPLFPLYYIWIGTIAARICSGLFNYNFNRLIFKSDNKVVSSGPKYLVVWLIQMGLSALCVNYLTRWSGISEAIVKLVVDTCLFFGSYKIQQLWVFQNREKEMMENGEK